tara:strand:+ start:1054 stop:1389 length:336 start_codon:yes stop_codon:yes gene_type:complete
MSNEEPVLISNQTFECLVDVLHTKPKLRDIFNNEVFAKQLLISLLAEEQFIENGFWHEGLIKEFFEKECRSIVFDVLDELNIDTVKKEQSNLFRRIKVMLNLIFSRINKAK